LNGLPAGYDIGEVIPLFGAAFARGKGVGKLRRCDDKDGAQQAASSLLRSERKGCTSQSVQPGLIRDTRCEGWVAEALLVGWHVNLSNRTA
jgi:hypothetical protein